MAACRWRRLGPTWPVGLGGTPTGGFWPRLKLSGGISGVVLNSCGFPSCSTAGSPVIRGVPSTAILQVFWSVNGPVIPAGSYILSVDSASQVTISNPATSTIGGDAIRWGGTFSNPTEPLDFDPVMNTIHQTTSALPDGNLSTEGSRRHAKSIGMGLLSQHRKSSSDGRVY